VKLLKRSIWSTHEGEFPRLTFADESTETESSSEHVLGSAPPSSDASRRLTDMEVIPDGANIVLNSQYCCERLTPLFQEAVLLRYLTALNCLISLADRVSISEMANVSNCFFK
jgi:hypothetical protein